jgi:hypothetical protein
VSVIRHPGVPLDLASALVRRAEGELELQIGGAADDLLEYQAIAAGGWMMLDVAGCAI